MLNNTVVDEVDTKVETTPKVDKVDDLVTTAVVSDTFRETAHPVEDEPLVDTKVEVDSAKLPESATSVEPILLTMCADR